MIAPPVKRPVIKRGENLRSVAGKAFAYGDAQTGVVLRGRANYSRVRQDYASGR